MAETILPCARVPPRRIHSKHKGESILSCACNALEQDNVRKCKQPDRGDSCPAVLLYWMWKEFTGKENQEMCIRDRNMPGWSEGRIRRTLLFLDRSDKCSDASCIVFSGNGFPISQKQFEKKIDVYKRQHCDNQLENRAVAG